MKNLINPRSRQIALRQLAFTLIELLVVIAIIVALAAMLFPIMNRVSVTQAKAVAKTQLHQLDTAIRAYQAKYSFYPPDNPASPYTNTLYYELVGTIRTNENNDPNRPTYYMPLDKPLDGTTQITSNGVNSVFNITGFANSSVSTRGSDERPAAVSFLKELKPDQVGNVGPGAIGAKILLCTAGSETNTATGGSPWRYNSSHPTNNPSSFDLWVDIHMGGKRFRFSNWSSDPQLAL
jgi:prepilin-type N-terminal cleavage/methylation domain-containing protein